MYKNLKLGFMFALSSVSMYLCAVHNLADWHRTLWPSCKVT